MTALAFRNPQFAMPTPPTQFLELADELGVSFDAGDLDLFSRFLDLLLETNEKFNLTAIRDRDEAWIKHIFDSLTLMPLLSDLEPGDCVADVGSGCGSPGLPLAIAMPDLQFMLIESTKKKADFLQFAAEELAPGRVEIVAERAETVGRTPTRRGQCAAVVARALGPLRVSLELTVPLIRPSGLALFIKGARAETEIADAESALNTLRCKVIETLPTPTGRIVVVEKQGGTPSEYPRRPGEPKRDPL
jgi:16S rRNA (guanine527-N7)-methyltransferase